MSSLTTRSAFTYGHSINDSNRFIDFDEGSGEISAEIDVGSYSLDNFPNKIAQALNRASQSLTFTVTLDRLTRTITISADGNFDILGATGTNSAISALSLIGFDAVDLTSDSSYEAPNPSGFIYRPQFKLQSFTPFENEEQTSESVVKQSASGIVQVASFGRINFMEANIRYITDLPMSSGHDSAIENNPNAVSEAVEFLQYIIGKKPVEFIPDRSDLNNFTQCLLESSSTSRDGTGFKLSEMRSQGLAFYFETGVLKFRQII